MRATTTILSTALAACAIVALWRTGFPIPPVPVPEAPFGCPARGTVFTYDILSGVTGRPNEFRILDAEPFTCWINSSSWSRYAWIGGAVVSFSGKRDIQNDMIERLWPLHAGNRAEGKDPWKRDISLVVESYGDVTVPYGTLKAFKIVKTFVTQEATHRVSVWWAPALSWVVKQRSEMLEGPPPREGLNNWSLVRVTPPPPEGGASL